MITRHHITAAAWAAFQDWLDGPLEPPPDEEEPGLTRGSIAHDDDDWITIPFRGRYVVSAHRDGRTLIVSNGFDLKPGDTWVRIAAEDSFPESALTGDGRTLGDLRRAREGRMLNSLDDAQCYAEELKDAWNTAAATAMAPLGGTYQIAVKPREDREESPLDDLAAYSRQVDDEINGWLDFLDDHPAVVTKIGAVHDALHLLRYAIYDSDPTPPPPPDGGHVPVPTPAGEDPPPTNPPAAPPIAAKTSEPPAVPSGAAGEREGK
jgi:hypothetical protein